MGGGPGGSGGGIQSESLLWAIIMSAFAGASPSQRAKQAINPGAFRVRWYPIRVCQSIATLHLLTV